MIILLLIFFLNFIFWIVIVDYNKYLNKLSLLFEMCDVFLLTMKYDPKILPKIKKYDKWSEYKIIFFLNLMKKKHSLGNKTFWNIFLTDVQLKS